MKRLFNKVLLILIILCLTPLSVSANECTLYNRYYRHENILEKNKLEFKRVVLEKQSYIISKKIEYTVYLSTRTRLSSIEDNKIKNNSIHNQSSDDKNTKNIQSWSIGYPDGQMANYRNLSEYEFLYQIQSIIDQGYLVKFGGYFAGHNPGVCSFINTLDVGDKVRISYENEYRDLTVIDRGAYPYDSYYEDVIFSNGVNAWHDVVYGNGRYQILQFCLNEQLHMFLME